MKAITCFALTLIALLSFANGGFLPAHSSHSDELESPPQYEFQYAVHDAYTGDIKDQFEHRRGHYVTGRYSLVEPDGKRRIVDYSSDPLLGFTAQVRRE